MSQLFAPFLQVRIVDAIDIALVTAIVYTGLVWLRRTQAWLVAAGMLILGAFYVVARTLELQLTAWIFQGFFAVFLVMIVVIFQEELRQMFETVAVWGLGRARRPPVASETTDILVRALADMAHARVGALIVIPGRQPIDRHVRGGIELGGRVSYPLVRSLFDTHSPGHDGGVIIRGDTATHFAVQLPLSADFQQLAGTGTRHAAALGLAELCDALCLVVSEERGKISVAVDGRLQRDIEATKLGEMLRTRLAPPPRERNAARVWRETVRKNWVEKLAALTIVVSLWYLFVPGARPTIGTYPVKVSVANLPEGYVLDGITPTEVWVTLSGPARAFYFFDTNQIEVTVDTALAVLGRRTFQVTERDVKHPRDVSFEQVDPKAIKILRPALIAIDTRALAAHEEPLMKPEDIERIAPGLGRLMPEVGDRTWKAYYAAQAGNWPLARFQAKEVRKLLDLCAFTRPKYDGDLKQFLEKFWKPLEDAIAAEDFAAFQVHFRRSVDSGNAYHRKYDKPFIVWKLPDQPPPDLDLTPQKR